MKEEPRPKMPPEQRAKQFMPFAAVKGLEEALSRQEIRRQEKIEPDESEIEAINQALTGLELGDRVYVSYFCRGSYTQAIGRVTAINAIRQYLEVEKARIRFSDIRSLTPAPEQPLM